MGVHGRIHDPDSLRPVVGFSLLAAGSFGSLSGLSRGGERHSSESVIVNGSRCHPPPDPVPTPVGRGEPVGVPVVWRRGEDLHTEGRRRHHGSAITGGGWPRTRPRSPRTGMWTRPRPRWAWPGPRPRPGSEPDDLLVGLERDLWVLMAELATAPGQPHKLHGGEPAGDPSRWWCAGVAHRRAERAFRYAQGVRGPGQNRVSAALDVARTVVRRAERRTHGGGPGPGVLRRPTSTGCPTCCGPWLGGRRASTSCR